MKFQVEVVCLDGEYLQQQRACPDCGRLYTNKDAGTTDVKTVFGSVRVANPRWNCCACQSAGPLTFRPMRQWRSNQSQRCTEIELVDRSIWLAGGALPLASSLNPQEIPKADYKVIFNNLSYRPIVESFTKPEQIADERPYNGARLLLSLYELRREPKMPEARETAGIVDENLFIHNNSELLQVWERIRVLVPLWPRAWNNPLIVKNMEAVARKAVDYLNQADPEAHTTFVAKMR